MGRRAAAGMGRRAAAGMGRRAWRRPNLLLWPLHGRSRPPAALSLCAAAAAASSVEGGHRARGHGRKDETEGVTGLRDSERIRSSGALNWVTGYFSPRGAALGIRLQFHNSIPGHPNCRIEVPIQYQAQFTASKQGISGMCNVWRGD